jgi:hypothetical protein
LRHNLPHVGRAKYKTSGLRVQPIVSE